MIHIIRFEQTATLHWIATCSCTWRSERYVKLSEAEREGAEHSKEHE